MNKAEPTIISRPSSIIVMDFPFVYKIYTESNVELATLRELWILDKIANTPPVILDVGNFEDFMPQGNFKQNGPTLKMRALDYTNQLDTVLLEKNAQTSGRIITSLTVNLYRFYSNTPKTDINTVVSFSSDIDVITSNAHVYARYSTLLRELKTRYAKAFERFSDMAVASFGEIHGDLDLSNILYDQNNDIFILIDFNQRKRFRSDHFSKDLGGIYLNLIEIDKFDLSRYFLELSSTQYHSQTPKVLTDLIVMQALKKALLRYFTAFGGFDPQYRDEGLSFKSEKAIEYLCKIDVK